MKETQPTVRINLVYAQKVGYGEWLQVEAKLRHPLAPILVGGGPTANGVFAYHALCRMRRDVSLEELVVYTFIVKLTTRTP
jgi:hypothetical protein